MEVNPDFWVLWVVVVPVTLMSLGTWRATELESFKWPLESARFHLPQWWTTQKSRGPNRGSGTIMGGTELRDLGSQVV